MWINFARIIWLIRHHHQWKATKFRARSASHKLPWKPLTHVSLTSIWWQDTHWFTSSRLIRCTRSKLLKVAQAPHQTSMRSHILRSTQQANLEQPWHNSKTQLWKPIRIGQMQSWKVSSVIEKTLWRWRLRALPGPTSPTTTRLASSSWRGWRILAWDFLHQ